MVRWLVVVALAGCHFHRDVNAPGIVDPMVPPENLGAKPEYPADPGEHRLMMTTGLIGGGGGSTSESGAGFGELGAEVTLSYGQSDVTHNDHALNLLPKGVVVPPKSYGMTLGWSGLRFVEDKLNPAEIAVKPGPFYVEGQKSWGWYGFGGGWALDPRTGATGPQVQGFLAIYYLRTRVLFGDGGGFEIGGGVQLKLPTTWTWRRK